MAILIPYGVLEGGKYGINLWDAPSAEEGKPRAAVVEVFENFVDAEAPGDPANFNGRLIFAIDTQTLYVYKADTPEWFPLEGIPAEVGAVGGSPPIVPPPQVGFLFYDTDTEVMFVWDGAAWRPIGGRFAARYVQQQYTSTGVAGPGGDTFAMGTIPVYSEFVEVFLDGVRQQPNPGGDYNVIGANVVFPAPVGAGVRVFIRTLESTVLEDPAILQNAQCIAVDYIDQAAGIFTFDAGGPGLDPSCTFVYRNGLLLSGGGVDYSHDSVDTTINAIIKTGATVAQVTTASAHNAGAGDVITITGAAEAEYTGSFTISSIVSPTVFEIPVVVTAPASATQASVSVPISYSPPLTNDNIILSVPTALNDDILIRSFQRVIVAPSTGEANTASNLGTGVGLFSTKSGEDLRFKSISGGNGIQIVDGGGGTVTIAADAIITFESRNGINTSIYNLATTDSYIGVRNTGVVVTINVSTVPGGTAGSGRRVVITDESGGAGTNNIQIVHGGALFSGAPSPLIIDADYGSVTIVYDGTNWHVVSKTF